MKIGIMGGTFNPIHLGHLILSEHIREAMGLDKIIFIPTGQPPHKNGISIVDRFHRKIMTELSIEDNPHFILSDIEIKRPNKSYTIDTVYELKRQYKDDSLVMIIGADSLMNIEQWKDALKLLNEIDFVVADRITKQNENVLQEIDRLNITYNINIKYIDTPIIEISSTEIRNKIKKNESIKYLVNKNVHRYILENNLYK